MFPQKPKLPHKVDFLGFPVLKGAQRRKFQGPPVCCSTKDLATGPREATSARGRQRARARNHRFLSRAPGTSISPVLSMVGLRRRTQPNHRHRNDSMRPKMNPLGTRTLHGGKPDSSQNTSQLGKTYPRVDIRTCA